MASVASVASVASAASGGSPYRQLWHLTSEGWGYCALGTFSHDGLPPEWRAVLPMLPLRDRYSPVKAARMVLVTMQIRGAAPASARQSDPQRPLYYVYRAWSTQRVA
ncbi:hypothetical protein FCJ59_12240 [Cupriavidus basilensis]|nr:hypothetical protein [Cupriavidus basilensis]